MLPIRATARPRRGRRAVGEKVRLLDQALGLWRGSPLVDVRYEEFAQGEIRRLEELRVYALEELLEPKMELGAWSGARARAAATVFDGSRSASSCGCS